MILRICIADVLDQVKLDYRVKVAGHLGSWMMSVAREAQGVTGAEISWWTKGGRFRLGPKDVLIYVVSEFQSGAAMASGNANGTPESAGATFIYPAQKRALSEVYWGKITSPLAFSSVVFHEAAHNKSLQDNKMHGGRRGGILEAFTAHGVARPTADDFKFFAEHALTEVSQIVVPQTTLKNFWYRGKRP
jgi:hypothetical protein